MVIKGTKYHPGYKMVILHYIYTYIYIRIPKSWRKSRISLAMSTWHPWLEFQTSKFFERCWTSLATGFWDFHPQLRWSRSRWCICRRRILWGNDVTNCWSSSLGSFFVFFFLPEKKSVHFPRHGKMMRALPFASVSFFGLAWISLGKLREILKISIPGTPFVSYFFRQRKTPKTSNPVALKLGYLAFQVVSFCFFPGRRGEGFTNVWSGWWPVAWLQRTTSGIIYEPRKKLRWFRVYRELYYPII